MWLTIITSIYRKEEMQQNDTELSTVQGGAVVKTQTDKPKYKNNRGLLDVVVVAVVKVAAVSLIAVAFRALFQ